MYDFNCYNFVNIFLITVCLIHREDLFNFYRCTEATIIWTNKTVQLCRHHLGLMFSCNPRPRIHELKEVGCFRITFCVRVYVDKVKGNPANWWENYSAIPTGEGANPPHQLVGPDPPHQLVGPDSPHQLVRPDSPHQLVRPETPHQLVGSERPHGGA